MTKTLSLTETPSLSTKTPSLSTKTPTFRALLFAASITIASMTWPAAAQHIFDSESDILRASDMVGSPVVTRNGKDVGKVQDLALDRESGELAYVVVSVGSFLIEHSLIAVQPDALQSDGSGRLVLYASLNDLQRAQRFASDGWPLAPDVLGTAEAPDEAAKDPAELEAIAVIEREAQLSTGTATIQSDTRTASLSAGEKVINEIERPKRATNRASREGKIVRKPVPRPEGAPITNFDRLDKDNDGFLSRIEIAAQLSFRDSYSDLDLDGNGMIDRAEFFPLEE